MKNDPVCRSGPFCPSNLFHLMFKNFVGPHPIKEIVEPRICRSEGETIYSEGMVRIISRSDIFAVGLPHRVGPGGVTYLKPKCH